MIDLLHPSNSTTDRIWVSNPQTRGTWTICSTCVLTIALCVWQAVHLDMPAPHEGFWRHFWRRIGWSVLAWIAPELVAFNAWLQHRTAKRLLCVVRKHRPPPENIRPHRGLTSLLLSGSWRTKAALKTGTIEGDSIELVPPKPSPPPWTMACAFYATSGGVVLAKEVRHQTNQRTPACKALELICELEPENIPPLDPKVISDKSKANGLSKALTCLQVSWFCGQCFTRLHQGFAISLLELNTLGHCVCALVIMRFWWHKPYGIETHEVVDSKIIGALRRLSSPVAADNDLDCRRWGDIAPSNPGLAPAVKEELTLESVPRKRDTVRVSHEQAIPGTNFIVSAEPTKAGSWVLQLSLQNLEAWQTIWQYIQNPAWNAIVNSRPRISPWHATHQWTLHRSRTWRIDFTSLKPYWRERDFLVFAASFMLACTLYGGLHLLAWNYVFATRFEARMWKVSGAYTVGSWVVHLLVEQAVVWLQQDQRTVEEKSTLLGTWQEDVHVPVLVLKYCHYSAMIVFRAFLVIESIVALPNSPLSVYDVPAWSAYVPHFA